MDKAYVVPLHELLAGVPRGTRLEINDPDGMGTRFIPVGRYCHEAAEALRAALAQPEREWVGLTDDEVGDIGCDFATLGGDIEGKNWFAFYLAIEAKLKEKNDND